MSKYIQVTANLQLTDSGTAITGEASSKSDVQVDATGKFARNILVTSSSATEVPMGSVSVSAGTTYAWVEIKNVDSTDSVDVYMDGGSHGVGRIPPGQTWGPCYVDFIPYVKRVANTPTIWVTAIQA